MKIFLSHSSKNKPLIREVKSYFPEHIKLWVDEKDLLIGENLDGSIKSAIETDSDFVIIFLDLDSIKSEWVLKELEWALEHEKKIKRNFILPVLLDREVLNSSSPYDFIKRKYLFCYDYSESTIQNLSTNLISELFALLSKDLDKKSTTIIDSKNDALLKLKEADQFVAKIADQVRLLVYSYRKENPLEVEKLFKLISSKEDFSSLTLKEFLLLLERFQNQGFLSGIVCNGFNIYVEEEHFAWKTSVFSSAKQKIARKAISYIKSGFIISLDAGSTTLELAKQISAGLKMKAWKNLKIITNSLSVANEILQTASEMGWDDETSLVSLYIIGGRIRPNTLAIVNDDLKFKRDLNDDFKNMNTLLGSVDISFIGVNGIHKDFGFTTHNDVEVYTKKDLMLYSKRSIILADPSKFGIKEQEVFADFNDPLEVITTFDSHEAIITEYCKFLETTNIKIIVS